MPYKPGTREMLEARRHAMNAQAAAVEAQQVLAEMHAVFDLRLDQMRSHLRAFNLCLIALDPPDPPPAGVVALRRNEAA